jgi:hypothetical protein
MKPTKPSRLERRIENSVNTGICAAVTVSASFAFAATNLMPLALFTGLVASILSTVTVIILVLIERDIEVIRRGPLIVVRLPLDE